MWALGHMAEFRSSWLCGLLEATLVSTLSTSSEKGSRWPETQGALHAEPLESAQEMHVVTEASGGQKTPSCSSGQRRSKCWGLRIKRPFPARKQGLCAEVSRRDQGWKHTHGAEQEERFEQQKVPECGAGSHPKPPLEIATGSAFGDSWQRDRSTTYWKPEGGSDQSIQIRFAELFGDTYIWIIKQSMWFW